MRKSALTPGIFYIILGFLFTFFAIQNIQRDGEWGFFTYLLILLATFDIGSGIKLIALHIKMKNIEMKK